MNEWWAAARANPVFRMAMIIAVAIIAVDQASKLCILHGIDLDQGCQRLSDGRLVGCTNRNIELGPVFDLTYVENTGVSFGLFAGGMVSRVLLTILAVVVAGFVVHWAGRLNRRAAAIGAGLIVGGALGNAIDRSFYGFVVDFLNFKDIGFPWVFNVADSAINVGVAFLAYDAFFVAPKSATKTDSAETTASLSSDEPGERKAKETFPAKDPASIRPEDQDSRSPE